MQHSGMVKQPDQDLHCFHAALKSFVLIEIIRLNWLENRSEDAISMIQQDTSHIKFLLLFFVVKVKSV